jgi:hypothetical protein
LAASLCTGSRRGIDVAAVAARIAVAASSQVDQWAGTGLGVLHRPDASAKAVRLSVAA